MLAKIHRLAKKNDINALFKQGKRAFCPFFTIRYFPNSLEFSRVTVVVSNKVSKKATQRNRIKRQAREIIRLSLSKFTRNIDLMVNVMSMALDNSYQDLENQLLKLLKKNNLIND